MIPEQHWRPFVFMLATAMLYLSVVVFIAYRNVPPSPAQPTIPVDEKGWTFFQSPAGAKLYIKDKAITSIKEYPEDAARSLGHRTVIRYNGGVEFSKMSAAEIYKQIEEHRGKATVVDVK